MHYTTLHSGFKKPEFVVCVLLLLLMLLLLLLLLFLLLIIVLAPSITNDLPCSLCSLLFFDMVFPQKCPQNLLSFKHHKTLLVFRNGMLRKMVLRLTFKNTSPLSTIMNPPIFSRISFVASLIWIFRAEQTMKKSL